MQEGRGSFSGPLFILGRPRSGTKLLRTLLNEHPRVGIPISETHFFPEMVRRFGNPPQLDSPARFDEFYAEFSRSLFFAYRRHFGMELTKDELQRRARLDSWESIFGEILRFYASKPIHAGVIWGDKSPGYLTEIPFLRTIFPSARFLHIIRDPRDQALSARRVWGKHLYRSAQRWRQDVAKAHRDGMDSPGDYLEVTYEGLLTETEKTLRAVCEFLEIPFDAQMLTLSVSHEDRGQAAGQRRVVPDNLEKYLGELSTAQIRRIEEITFSEALRVGYRLRHAEKERPVSRAGLLLYKALDGITMTRFYANDHGPAWALQYVGQKLLPERLRHVRPLRDTDPVIKL